MKAHKRLREMSKAAADVPGKSSQDCSICLDPIAVSLLLQINLKPSDIVVQPCQSLFVAPCSHTWHYKCIRTILNGPMWPHFLCPNCRAVADLEAEVDDPYADGDWEDESEPMVAAVPEVAAAPAPAVRAPIEEIHEAELEDDLASSSGPDDPSPNSSVDNISEITDESTIPQDASAAIAYPGLEPRNAETSLTHPLLASHQPSHTSSAPIPIKGRKSIATSRTPSTINAPRLANEAESSSDGERAIGAVASPLARALRADVNSVDGPMTPRNDAGPFVFDGSAGRAGGLRLSETLNLGAAADESASSSTPTDH